MAYTDEYPFEAYITNLGKYNEGSLVGEWVSFPTTAEEIQDVFKRIGIDGVRYEEWFITDYDCNVAGMYGVLGEYENLDELNYLAAKITELDKHEYERFEAAIQLSDYSRSAKDLINLTDNLDKYDIYPDVNSYDDLGRLYIEEYGSMEIPEHLSNYIDYEAYGRDIAMDEISEFTDFGYVRDTGDSFTEYYDGDRDSIPKEYRVMLGTDDMEFDDDELDPEQDADTMTVLVVEPGKEPYIKEIAPGLAAMQAEVDGMIAATYPFDDRVAVICNDEGKINGMELNRALRDSNGEIYDIVAGTFLVTGLGEENFSSLSSELAEKYMEHFKTPELFAMVNDQVIAIPVPAAEQTAPLILPDDSQTGERIQTPRGSFSVTNMTREQMEAAGYGYHHSSDDGVYHIMGNGTRAFAIMNGEHLPEKEAHISFFVAECIEFSDMGEYYNNLTLDEAIKYYEDIPSDRMNGVKGIGFTLEDGSLYDGDCPLMTGNTIDLATLNNIEHYRQSPLVQQAVHDLIEKMPQATVIGEVENHLKNAEMAMEDDYSMIDGIINNGPKEASPPGGADEKPSIRERLSEAKQECQERKPPEIKKPEKSTPEHGL